MTIAGYWQSTTSSAEFRWFGWSPVFFFQAEDGIRPYKVTGVQTCALPISVQRAVPGKNPPHRFRSESQATRLHGRSEERRVGKESRDRRRRNNKKKKK